MCCAGACERTVEMRLHSVYTYSIHLIDYYTLSLSFFARTEERGVEVERGRKKERAKEGENGKEGRTDE